MSHQWLKKDDEWWERNKHTDD